MANGYFTAGISASNFISVSPGVFKKFSSTPFIRVIDLFWFFISSSSLDGATGSGIPSSLNI